MFSDKIKRLKAALSAMKGHCSLSDEELENISNTLEAEYDVKILENPYADLPPLENMGPFKSGKDKRRERRKQERLNKKKKRLW